MRTVSFCNSAITKPVVCARIVVEISSAWFVFNHTTPFSTKGLEKSLCGFPGTIFVQCENPVICEFRRFLLNSFVQTGLYFSNSDEDLSCFVLHAKTSSLSILVCSKWTKLITKPVSRMSRQVCSRLPFKLEKDHDLQFQSGSEKNKRSERHRNVCEHFKTKQVTHLE